MPTEDTILKLLSQQQLKKKKKSHFQKLYLLGMFLQILIEKWLTLFYSFYIKMDKMVNLQWWMDKVFVSDTSVNIRIWGLNIDNLT